MIDTKLLRQKILDLAIRGKLVPQDPTDEPASELLKKIKAEKDALVKAGKIKKDKHESHIFKGDDNRYYEQIDGKTADITDEIPFDLPESWTWCRLREIGNILYGVSESTKANGCYKLLRITDIQNDSVNWQTVPFTDFSGDATTYFLRDGDIVFARTGATVGKSFLIESTPQNAIYASYLIRVRFIFATVAKFIKNFFGSSAYWEQIIAKSVGTGQPNVNGTSLSDLFLPIPPLAEQQRIVEQIETLLGYVDIIDTDAETLEKSITLAKQKILDLAIRGKLVSQDPADEPASELLKKIKAEKDALVKAGKIKKDKHESYIFKSDDNCYHENIAGKITDITDEIPFDLPDGWCWCRLKQVFSVVSARRVHKADWKSFGIPFYRAREIAKLSEFGSISNDLFISEEQYNAFKQSSGVPSQGDLMVTAVGTIGKVYVVKKHDVFYYKDASVVCFENYHSLNPYFYKSIFSSPFMLTQIYANSTGSTVDTITIEKAEQYLIPLPPLAEQKRIVSQVEKLFAVLETMLG